MKIEITSEHYNRLLKRKEITFKISSFVTPPLVEVRKELASILKQDLETVFVIKLRTKTGTHETVGEAEAYDSSEEARRVVPRHIRLRNTIPTEKAKK